MYASQCAKEILDCEVFSQEAFLSGRWLTHQLAYFLLLGVFARFIQGHWGHLRFPAAFYTNPLSSRFGLVVPFLLCEPGSVQLLLL